MKKQKKRRSAESWAIASELPISSLPLRSFWNRRRKESKDLERYKIREDNVKAGIIPYCSENI
jgi:hypothetical protein